MSSSHIVDNGDFDGNTFTNLAPLLVLFGDQITKQFLSTSVGWPDDILLGIAPVGIITTIVCAIRVGGNKFMKSFIGRAQNSPDEDEKDILSSTSANVREIWDGHRVVRQIGMSKTEELAYDPFYDSPAPKKVFYHGHELLDPRLSIFRQRPPLLPLERSESPPKRAPNLVFNIAGAIPERSRVVAFVLSGLLIQAAVMAFNALIVYHWKLLRGKNAVEPYGYPTWVAGTVFMSVGTSLCARVVETSTTRFTLRPREIEDHFRIIRIQRKIPELGLPAFAINNEKGNDQTHIVERDWRERALLTTVTSTGSILTLAGFILQNIGIRELHWSAAVLQLAATVLLVSLRALLRVQVGNSPKPSPIHLSDGLEAAHLISHLESVYCWIPREHGWLSFSRATKHLQFKQGLRSVLDRPCLKKKKSMFIKNSRAAAASWSAGRARRIIGMHTYLSSIEPASPQISQVASNLCSAIEDIIASFGTRHWQDRKWVQHVVLTSHPAANPTIDGISSFCLFSRDQSQLSVHKNICAIIAMTLYHSQECYAKRTYPIRILGRCNIEDLATRTELFRHYAGAAEPDLIFGSWKRDVAGRVREVDLRLLDPASAADYPRTLDVQVLGHRYSMISPDLDGTPIDPTTECEIIATQRHVPCSEIHWLGVDLFASFMLDFARAKKDELQAFLQRRKGACEIFANILRKHGVCESREEAMMMIVPALVACGLVINSESEEGK